MTTPEPPEQKRSSKKTLYIVLGAVVAFGAIIGIGQVFINQNSTPLRAEAETPAAQATTEEPQGAPSASESPVAAPGKISAEDSPLALRDPDDYAALGAVDAPLVLIEWTDLRCPFCAAFTNDTFPTITKEYIDSGKVRLEVAPIAMFGDQSFDAAVATHAAGEQGMFFEYLRTVYAAAPEGGKPDLTREVLLSFAEQAGIPNIEQFTTDLDSPELHKKVSDETAFARQIGVNSVPFFVAGEVSLPGAQSIDTFREYLNHFDIDGK